MSGASDVDAVRIGLTGMERLKTLSMISKKSVKTAAPILGLFLFLIVQSCNKTNEPPPYGEGEVPSVSTPPSVGENLAEQAGLERMIYHVGPVDLPAHTDVRAMMDRPLTMRFQTDKEVWVTGFSPRVVDANGSELSGELLHEAFVSNAHEENPLCAGAPNPFFVATSVLTELDLPRGYGYPVLATDPIEARVILKNPTDTNYANVFFEIALSTRPMSEFGNISDVRPVLIEQSPCDHSSPAVAPRTFDSRERIYEIPYRANLVAANAVLQDFGSSVELTKGDETQGLWRAEADVDVGHRIQGFIGNPFEDAEGISFNTDDRLKLTTAYDNTSDAWLQAATAAAIVYLSPR